MRKPLTLDDLADVLTLKEAADAVGMTQTTLRVNIKSGELRAFLPRGKDPKHAGRGQGYRIQKTALESWYFNKPEVK